MPIFKYHLTPRVKGYLTLLPCVKDTFGSICDLTIGVSANGPYPKNFLSIISQKPMTVHFYMKRYAMNQVPIEGDPALDFLYNIFRNKVS